MTKNDDRMLASWLLQNRRRFEGLNPADYGQLADDVVTAERINSLASGTTFRQILNDVRRIVDGEAAPSPTVEFMLAQSSIGPDSVVLDVGCSAGRHLWELAPRAPRFMMGADIQFFPMAIGALAWQAQDVPVRPKWCAASILNLPFKNEAFTHVHCFVTLSVVPVQAALAELVRVLAPGGQLLVTMEGMGFWQRDWDEAPFFSRQRLNLLRQWTGERLLRLGVNWQQSAFLRRLAGHVTYSQRTLERIMARAGLVIDAFQVLNAYKDQPLLYGLTLHKR